MAAGDNEAAGGIAAAGWASCAASRLAAASATSCLAAASAADCCKRARTPFGGTFAAAGAGLGDTSAVCFIAFGSGLIAAAGSSSD
jgi:hypothetical protein